MRPFLLSALALALLSTHLLAVGPGPSVVTVSGRQLQVRKRNLDGSLSAVAPYAIRGVAWAPASKTTNTSPSDPNNATVRRVEFGNWYLRDIPLMRSMNVNTVRTFLDMGVDATALAVLDKLYENNIMVVLTVDNAINDTSRITTVVNYYKDHPAVLMWLLGNEWNLNRYYGVASTVQDAAARTQTAAALIKTLDTNHPVATSYGDIDGNLSTFVNTTCPAVDVWAMNIYRGSSFGNLFTQWSGISSKPLFLSEYGTDAFRSFAAVNPPNGVVDEDMQTDFTFSLWNELFRNLSATDAAKAALGGFVFAWSDEWWKVSPAGSQETSGFTLVGGHPDDFSNEEFFGIVDIDRKPRGLYCALRSGFDAAYSAFSEPVLFRALSRGGSAGAYGVSVARFTRGGKIDYEKTGGAGGGRGFNVLAIDATTGNAIQPAQNFDTWATRDTGNAMNNLITFLDGLPNGSLILLSVADEAGLALDDSCTKRASAWTESGLQKLESLGARQIRSYCFRDSWAMATVKGEAQAKSESLGHAVPAVASSQPLLTSCKTPAAAFRNAQSRVNLLLFGVLNPFNAGGVFGSQPSVASDEVGSVWAAAKDTWSGIWLNRFDPGPKTFTGWLFAAGVASGAPALASASGVTFLSIRDPWGAYWLNSYSAAAGLGSWLNLGGVFSVDPAMTACPDGSLYLAGKDNWNSLWGGRYIPGSGFQGWHWGQGILKGKLSAACGSDNAAYILARDNWDGVWINRLSGNTWSGWQFGGGNAGRDPQIAAGQGQLFVSVVDPWGGVYYRRFLEGAGNNWQDWKTTQGSLDDAAPVVLGSEFYVAGRDTSNNLWWYRSGATPAWSFIGQSNLVVGPLATSPR
jgi:hypothetical protein